MPKIHESAWKRFAAEQRGRANNPAPIQSSIGQLQLSNEPEIKTVDRNTDLSKTARGKLIAGYEPKGYEPLKLNVGTEDKPDLIPVFRDPTNYKVVFYTDLFLKKIEDVFSKGNVEEAKKIFEEATSGSFEYNVLTEPEAKRKINRAISSLTDSGLIQQSLELATLCFDRGINFEGPKSKTTIKLVQASEEVKPLETCKLLTSAIKIGLRFDEKEILHVALITSRDNKTKENMAAFAKLLLTAIDYQQISKENEKSLEFLSIALYVLSDPKVHNDKGETGIEDVIERTELACTLGRKIMEEDFPLYKLTNNQKEGINSLVQNVRHTSRNLAALNGQTTKEGNGALNYSDYFLDRSLSLMSIGLYDHPVKDDSSKSEGHYIRLDNIVSVMEGIRLREPSRNISSHKNLYEATALILQRFLPYRDKENEPRLELDKTFSDLIYSQIQFFFESNHPEYALKLAIKADGHEFPFETETLEYIHEEAKKRLPVTEYSFELKLLEDIINERKAEPSIGEVTTVATICSTPNDKLITLKDLEGKFEQTATESLVSEFGELIKKKNPLIKEDGFKRLTDKLIQRLRKSEKYDEAFDFAILCLQNNILHPIPEEATKTFKTLACKGHQSANPDHKVKTAVMLTHAISNGIKMDETTILITEKELEHYAEKPEHVLAHLRLATEAVKMFPGSNLQATLFFNLTLDKGYNPHFICGEKNLLEVYDRFKEIHRLSESVIKKRYPFHTMTGSNSGVKYSERIPKLLSNILTLSFKLRLWDEYLKNHSDLSTDRISQTFRGNEFNEEVMNVETNSEELNLQKKANDLIKSGLQLLALEEMKGHPVKEGTIALLLDGIRVNEIQIDDEMKEALEKAVKNTVPRLRNFPSRKMDLLIQALLKRTDDDIEAKNIADTVLSIAPDLFENGLYVTPDNIKILKERVSFLSEAGFKFDANIGEKLDTLLTKAEELNSSVSD